MRYQKESWSVGRSYIDGVSITLTNVKVLTDHNKETVSEQSLWIETKHLGFELNNQNEKLRYE